MSREKTRALALLLCVLLAGAVLGWFGHDWNRHAHGRGRGRGAEAMVNRLERDLHLNAAQKDSVRVILERHHSEIRALWQEVHPQYDSLRAVTRTEIRAQLTPEQQARYQRLVEEWERRDRAADSTGKGRHGRY